MCLFSWNIYNQLHPIWNITMLYTHLFCSKFHKLHILNNVNISIVINFNNLIQHPRILFLSVYIQMINGYTRQRNDLIIVFSILFLVKKIDLYLLQ